MKDSPSVTHTVSVLRGFLPFPGPFLTGVYSFFDNSIQMVRFCEVSFLISYGTDSQHCIQDSVWMEMVPCKRVNIRQAKVAPFT